MDHTRPRSRRLVTYGSSTRNLPHSKTTPARVSSAAEGFKYSQGKLRQPRPSKQELLGGENGGKRRTSPGAPMAAALTELPAIADDSIYDLPSSDDEDEKSTVRRKRRRYGSNGNASLHHDSLESRHPAVMETGTAPHDVPIMNLTTVGRRTENLSPRTRKSTRDRRWPPGQTRGEGIQLSPKRSTASSADDGTCKPPRTQLASDERKLPGCAETEKGFHEKSPRTSDRVSPGPQLLTRITARNTTPSRRRLIDSLGTREQLDDGSPPEMSIDGPLSSPFAHRSPTQPKDIGSPGMPTEGQRGGHGQDSAVPSSPHVRGSKVTYARQRSFLDDLSMANGLLGQNVPATLEEPDPLVSPHRSNGKFPRARLFAIEDVNNGDDDGSVRSIHELRQAGGNARYRGAVESIFEDIEDSHSSASGRCNALVQLCGKLLDSNLARPFVECGFDKRLVDCLSHNLDVVSAALTLCAFGLSSLSKSLPYVLATAAWPNLLDTSHILLDTQEDLSVVARTQGSTLSRPVQKSIQNIAPQIQSTLFPDAPLRKLSPCLLALNCLRVTISAFREKGESPSSLPLPLLKQLVNLLLSQSPHDDGSIGLAPERAQILIMGLSVLEAHTISGDPLQKEHRDILSLLSGMHGLLHSTSHSDATGLQMQTLYIRVILNVTNSNPMLCDDFATPTLVEQLAEIAMARFGDLTEDSLAQENNSLDTVILALGALINLTEQSEASRTMFLHSGRITESLLDRLSRLFLAHVDSTSKAHSVLEVHHNVAVGYLAVLLLALCLHPDARVQVKKSMSSNGLAVVMSTVDEFLQYHRKIEQELYPLQAKREASGFIGRLQGLASQVQRTEHE